MISNGGIQVVGPAAQTVRTRQGSDPARIPANQDRIRHHAGAIGEFKAAGLHDFQDRTD